LQHFPASPAAFATPLFASSFEFLRFDFRFPLYNVLMKNIYFSIILSVAFLTILVTPAALAEEQYLAIMMDGHKVGHAVHDRKVEGDQVLTTEEATLTITRLGFPITITTANTCVETKKGDPLGFEFSMDASGLANKVSGRVTPDGNFEITNGMGGEQKTTRRWPEGVLMSEGLRLLQLKKGLKEGTEYSCKVFVPESADALETHVTVGPKSNIDLFGRVLSLTEVKAEIGMPGGGTVLTTDYVDDDLNVYKNVESLAGISIEMLACTKEFALAPNDVYELVNRMFIESPTPIPNVNSAKSIAYAIAPTNNEVQLAFPSSDIQQMAPAPNGGFFINVRPLQLPEGVSFPYKGKDEQILESLKPTMYVQSESPEIKALAQRAVGSTKDAAQAVRRIESFVAEYIENKSLSVGYASATEVAASRQGDCTEFAVLATAMCRSIGIPAQVAMGIAYIDDYGSIQTSFGGHAWTRVYLVGKWYDIDAAFKSAGLGGFNAGHIALAYGNGDPTDFFQLAATIGNFKITELKITPPVSR
jgi:hypothetical protein